MDNVRRSLEREAVSAQVFDLKRYVRFSLIWEPSKIIDSEYSNHRSRNIRLRNDIKINCFVQQNVVQTKRYRSLISNDM